MRNKIFHWLWRWGPALGMMTVIFAASAMPGQQIPKFGLWDVLVKKGGHMTGYGLLAAAYLHGLTNGRRPTLRWAGAAVACAGLYGITDEYHQSFVSGRTPAWMDVMIDTAGAGLGAALAAWVSLRRR